MAEFSLPDSFATALHRYGSRPALITGDSAITYAELDERVREFAALLGSERRLVLLEASNDVGSLVAYLACLRAGHPVLMAPAESAHTRIALHEAYRPDVSIAGTLETRGITELDHDTRPHDLHPDLALLAPTSGSTGSPKLVRLSAGNLEANAESIASYLGIGAGDRAATTLPIHYCYGLSVVNSHLARGASLLLTEDSVVDNKFWDSFKDNAATSFAGVPYTFELLDRIGFDEIELPSLRYVTQAGGRLTPDAVKRYAQLGAAKGFDFFVMYGQTEATARMAYLPPALAEHRPEAVGVPVPGGSFRVESLDGSGEAAEGEAGELVYSGPNVMLGYAHGPDDLSLGRTTSSLRTGDIGRLAPDGLYEITGRRSRFIKVFGVRTDLDRAELVYSAHGIHACCVGTDQHLFVASENDLDRTEVMRIAADELGLGACSVRVCGSQQIPRLATGKPDYRELLSRAEAICDSEISERANAVAAAASPDVEPDLIELFRDVLGRTGVTDDSTFVSLGGDSLSYVEMSVELEQHLGHLPADWHVTPIRDLRPSRTARRKRGRSIEAGVLLRAVAAVTIVGTHIQLFSLRGSAHILVALAGYNFARFMLPPGSRFDRFKRQAISLARLAVPCAAWITAVVLLTDSYSAMNIAFLNAIIGPELWTAQWHFWFIELLIYIMLVTIPVMAVPAIDRVERKSPFWFAMSLVAVGLVLRFELVSVGITHTMPVFWLFALGWAAAKCENHWHRLFVSVVLLAAVPGFFDDFAREAVMLAGIGAITWVRGIRLPAAAMPVLVMLASSSLYIYLVHWQVYPHLLDYPLLALIASLIAGVLYWSLSSRAMVQFEMLVIRLFGFAADRRRLPSLEPAPDAPAIPARA